MESNFYKDINANLREANRDKILPFFPYLKLLLTAFEKLVGKKKQRNCESEKRKKERKKERKERKKARKEKKKDGGGRRRIIAQAPKVLDLWRGVKLDLKKMYPLNTTVVWWGISSCTPKKTVAEGFMGASGVRTLFRIIPKSAISIMSFSAFKGEEEYILPPGTQLYVDSVSTDKSGLTTVVLRENVTEKLVA